MQIVCFATSGLSDGLLQRIADMGTVRGLWFTERVDNTLQLHLASSDEMAAWYAIEIVQDIAACDFPGEPVHLESIIFVPDDLYPFYNPRTGGVSPEQTGYDVRLAEFRERYRGVAARSRTLNSLVGSFLGYINSLSLEHADYVTGRILSSNWAVQQLFTRLCLAWLWALAQQDQYDLRNEGSVKIARSIVERFGSAIPHV